MSAGPARFEVPARDASTATLTGARRGQLWVSGGMCTHVKPERPPRPLEMGRGAGDLVQTAGGPLLGAGRSRGRFPDPRTAQGGREALLGQLPPGRPG